MQLIRAADGTPLWAESFNEQYTRSDSPSFHHSRRAGTPRWHAALGEAGQACAWLEKTPRNYPQGLLKVDQYMDPLRAAPRFQALLPN